MKCCNENKKFAVLFFLGLWGLATAFAWGQTDRLNLIWNANSESDLYLYRVFRGNDRNHLQQVDSVYHPDTTFTDYHIQKGVQYFYGLKAVDFSLNASSMSDLLSVAIPKISGLPQSLELPQDTTVVFALDNYVNDPDNADNQLTWTVTGFSQVQASVSADRHLTLKTPHNWSGSERGLLRVEDPQHLFDLFGITITARYTNQAPVFATIAQVETNEDTPVRVNLAQYVQDEDTPRDQLTYSARQTAHLKLAVHDSVLTITPDKNWYGQAQIRVYVSDETGLSDSTDFTLVVEAVDDAPVLTTLPSIRMNQDTSVVIALDPYVWDVDNTKDELQWTFSNYSHVTLSFSESEHHLTIQSPSNWGGFEYIVVKVEDPQGKHSSDTLVVQVVKVSYAPQLSAIPEIIFNEDGTYRLNLNDYVYDKDTPLSNLYWEVKGNKNVHYSIDYVNKIVTLQGAKDWFGSETIWVKVVDPDQYADSVQVQVTVLPINDPPQIKDFPAVDLSRINPRSIAFRSYLTDVDNAVDELYLRAIDPGPINVNISENQISFEADQNWYGAQTMRLIVQDPAGAADTSSVLVYRQNLESAPTIIGLDSLHVNEDDERQINLAAHVTDPDNSSKEISWSVQGGVFVTATYQPQTEQIRLKPAPNWNGTENIVLKATDPQGHFDFDTLQVVVVPINDPPQVAPVPDISMLAGTYYTLDLTQYISDPDGYDDLVKIELLNNPQSYVGCFLDEGGLRATFFAPQGYHGQETFMLRVTDRHGLQAIAIFVLRVEASSISSKVLVHSFGSGNVMHLNWKTRMPTKDHLEYSQDWSFSLSTPQEAEYSTEHHVVLENLQPNATYHYRVISVDPQGLVVTNPDSVFKTGALVKGVNVFPIPFRANDPNGADGIYFTNLDEKSTIIIYNLLGDVVFKKEVTGPIFKWDVTNGNGKEVHSGLYFYYVNSKKGKEKGKIIIIR